jgi:Fic family protein
MLHVTLSETQRHRLQNLAVTYDRIGQVAQSLSEDERSHILTQSMISNIGASTRIENAVLTDVEIEWIDTVLKSEPHLEFANREAFIADKLSQDKQRSIEEVAGYRNAIQIAFLSPEAFQPMSVSAIKGMHREMLRYYADASHHQGDFKTVPNTVLEIDHATGRQRTVLKTADPGAITETAMADLAAWYNEQMPTDPWVVPTAVEFVYRFLVIHPFEDGNGRVSRLLFHCALMAPARSAFRHSAPLCAIDRAIEQTRRSYYHVLARCSGGVFSPDPSAYDYSFFLDYMIDILERSHENFNRCRERYRRLHDLPEAALKVLSCFRSEPELQLTTRDLIERTSIPRRTVVYSANKLLAGGFIQRHGKGPASRYRLVF